MKQLFFVFLALSIRWCSGLATVHKFMYSLYILADLQTVRKCPLWTAAACEIFSRGLMLGTLGWPHSRLDRGEGCAVMSWCQLSPFMNEKSEDRGAKSRRI